MREKGWRRANITLAIIIVAINAYTIFLPLMPSLMYWWQARGNQDVVTASVASYVEKTEQGNSKNKDEEKPTEDMSGNRLIIPRMMLNTKIIEGPESRAMGNLKKGAWRMPFSTNPTDGGNTVIAGHRFTYTESRGIFYYLDKLQAGDEIGIRWNDEMHTYRVVSSRVVPPTEVSVQQPTNDDRLTLYTCTPLWNPKDRLVIVAEPVEVTPL